MGAYIVDTDQHLCSCLDFRFQQVPLFSRCCKHLSGETGCIRPERLTRTAGPMLQKLHTVSTQIKHGWYWSEKLDGIRVVWRTSTAKHPTTCVTFRKGYQFNVPFSLPFALPPNTVLDGELVSCELPPHRLVSQIRMPLQHDGWRTVRFAVFDTPTHPGTWQERQEYLQGLFSGGDRMEDADGDQRMDVEDPRVFLVPQTVIPESDEPVCTTLREALVPIARRGGEGIVVQNPRQTYQHGRRLSGTAVKIKPYYAARVVRTGPKTVRHAGVECTATGLTCGLHQETTVYYLSKRADGGLVHATQKRPFDAAYEMKGIYW